MRTLIITEKPSVARDIAGVLGRFTSRDGYLENGQYVVSWAYGHLVELAQPEDYDPALKRWSLATLPIQPPQFKLNPKPETRKQFNVLKKLLCSDGIETIVNACDAGREGELIFRRIYGAAGCKKTIKRLWLSEATPAAVKEAFGKLRDGRELVNLGLAAEARSQADWLVGINATRAFTCRHNELLSVGRVQTPTLALVVAREKEIRAFKPRPYWEVWATFQKQTGENYWGKRTRGETDRLYDKVEAAAIARKIGPDGKVTRVEQKETREQPPTLFNLNDLQKEANKKHGLTAQQTLDAAQALYEKHKLTTYPRTDSRHLTEAIARDTLASRLAAVVAAPEYASLVPGNLPAPGKRYVDDKKVTDHHAIIPTAVKPDPADLGKNERLVYDLVARRFLAIFYPDARYAVTKVNTFAGGETFISKGRVELAPGWKTVYGKHDDREAENAEDSEDQLLPPLTEAEAVAVQKVENPEKQTKPPARYTEATLLAAMENAGKFVDDKEMAGTLKVAGGIGTTATRAAIIETLIKRLYIERQKKALVPTHKGETLVDLVPEQVKSPEMTARWEQGLLEIEQGELEVTRWLGGVKEFTREVVQMAREQEASNGVKQQREALGKCPLCGKEVVEIPKSYGCTGYKDGCKFAIWKEIAGKKISPAQAGTLLKKGRTGILKGFKSKTKKPFEASLALNEEGKVVFDFSNGR